MSGALRQLTAMPVIKNSVKIRLKPNFFPVFRFRLNRNRIFENWVRFGWKGSRISAEIRYSAEFLKFVCTLGTSQMISSSMNIWKTMRNLSSDLLLQESMPWRKSVKFPHLRPGRWSLMGLWCPSWYTWFSGGVEAPTTSCITCKSSKIELLGL